MLSPGFTIEGMSVGPEIQRQLLAAVTESTASLEAVQLEAQRMVAESFAARRAAVQAAMDAGVPREQIADAAGTSKARLYQILKG